MSKTYFLNTSVSNRDGNSATRLIRSDGATKLSELCDFMMFAFGFIHEHSFEFLLDGNKLSEDVPIDSFHLNKGQEITLHYDFGDDWMFKIVVEKVRDDNFANPLAIVGGEGFVVQYD